MTSSIWLRSNDVAAPAGSPTCNSIGKSRRKTKYLRRRCFHLLRAGNSCKVRHPSVRCALQASSQWCSRSRRLRGEILSGLHLIRRDRNLPVQAETTRITSLSANETPSRKSNSPTNRPKILSKQLKMHLNLRRSERWSRTTLLR